MFCKSQTFSGNNSKYFYAGNGIFPRPKCWYHVSSEMQVFILYSFCKNTAIGAVFGGAEHNNRKHHISKKSICATDLKPILFASSVMFTVCRFLQNQLDAHLFSRAAERSGDQMERGVGWTWGLRRLQPACNYLRPQMLLPPTDRLPASK